jgi:hypothetical protein
MVFQLGCANIGRESTTTLRRSNLDVKESADYGCPGILAVPVCGCQSSWNQRFTASSFAFLSWPQRELLRTEIIDYTVADSGRQLRAALSSMSNYRIRTRRKQTVGDGFEFLLARGNVLHQRIERPPRAMASAKR